MSIFDTLDRPVFLKDDSNAEKQLRELEALLESATGKAKDTILLQIQFLKAGIAGEKQVRYELENSHMPMYVLHDLFLEYKGLTAQIDYLIITRYTQYIIECKNLYGDIEINNRGEFVRTFSYGKYKKKEGIYSPITQNRRHLELIHEMRGDTRVFFKSLFENNFYKNYRSVVVLSNPKTVLNARYAKKEVLNQLIRADQLIEYIRDVDSSRRDLRSDDSDMLDLANFFLDRHKEQQVDYTKQFREMIAEEKKKEAAKAAVKENITPTARLDKNETLICPRCGAQMVKRVAKRGENVGEVFFGCSRFPKCRYIISI